MRRKIKNINGNLNEELTIFKVSYLIPKTNTQIMEYLIFTNEGVQLNLDICKDLQIQYSIPLEINEKDIYKYDPNSEFYNEICIQYKSESNTDVTQYDRKNDFNEKNMALCENDCEFKEYNKQSQKVICNCKIKRVFKSLRGIDKGKLLKKFTNYKNLFNLEVIKCYKLLFSKKGLISNIGNYIIISIIFIIIINLILFSIKGYQIFFNRIHGIINKNINDNIQEKILDQTKSNKINLNNKKNKYKSSPPKQRRNKKSKTHKALKSKSHISVSNEVIISKTNFPNINKEDKNILDIKRNDYEMNILSYKDALQYDDRNYRQYYLSLLRTKQLIIFTFYTRSDYNSRLIKINLFFSSFALYYTVKALFFNDEVMHVIYKNKGVYNFLFQLPQIIYSTIISIILGTILSHLSLTQNNVTKIKNSIYERESNEYKIEFDKFIKRLKLKFVLFFVINFSLLIFFWYYLSCFCAVYKNTQGYLIKDVLISFGISLIYPFLLNLLPGLFRIKSLKDRDGKHKYMFYFSKILQLL